MSWIARPAVMSTVPNESRSVLLKTDEAIAVLRSETSWPALSLMLPGAPAPPTRNDSELISVILLSSTPVADAFAVRFLCAAMLMEPALPESRVIADTRLPSKVISPASISICPPGLRPSVSATIRLLVLVIDPSAAFIRSWVGVVMSGFRLDVVVLMFAACSKMVSPA